MENKAITDLFNHPVSWLSNTGPDEDIAISSRIRLARNFSGIAFPTNASDSERNHILSVASSSIKSKNILKNPVAFNINLLSEVDKQFLLERHLISSDFCKNKIASSLIINKKETYSIMINEEDHFRLQVLNPGLSLKTIWPSINEIDEKLSQDIPFAFDNVLGYLTSCPTNIGTGIRASVMLNLPALTISGYINGVIQGVNKLGLAVRGIYGEGSASLGNLYQVSNQSTLGESELQIIERLENIIHQIIIHEKNARLKLLEIRRNFILDCIGRAYGTLRYAYLLSSKEALNSLSVLRMGVDLKMFESLNIHSINELFIAIQPAHLQKYAGKELTSPERDILRAEMVKKKLQ